MSATLFTTAFPCGRPARRCQRLLLTALLLALSACTTPPSLPPTAAGDDPASLNHWLVEGKLGYRSPEKNGSAFVRWQQQDATYHLQLNGPFGAAATVIQGDDNYAVLSQSGRQDLFAASGEELSEQLFGWPFPVKAMSYWIKGLAAPSSPATPTVDSFGLLTALEQEGWHLEFSEHSRQDRWALPGRIKGTHGPYSFVLVIKQWAPGRSPAP